MMTSIDFAAVLPEILLLCGACVVLLGDLFLADARRHVSFWLTQAVLAAAAWAALATMPLQPTGAFSGMVVDDMLADTLKFMSCVAVSLMLFYSRGYSAARGLFRGESFVLALFALLGMMVMIARRQLRHALSRPRAPEPVAVRDGRDVPRRRTPRPRRR